MSNKLLMIIVGAAGAILLFYYVLEKYREHKLVNRGLFEPLQDWQYNNFCRLAQREGYEDLFLAWMRQVRQKHGHSNIKLGHIFWVFQQCCHNEPVSFECEIPKFDDPKHCKVRFKFDR